MSEDTTALLGVLLSALVWATVRVLTAPQRGDAPECRCPECEGKEGKHDA